MTCRECRGQCCLFMAMPPDIAVSVLKSQGAPINRFRGSTEYLTNHMGLNIRGSRVVLDADVPMLSARMADGQRLHLAATPCKHLRADGRCDDYKNRPSVCREFNAQTAARFIVPKGCKHDRGTGVEVAAVVEKSRERMKE